MLVDRIIFFVREEGIGKLKVVNRLRDYREFGGILFPTRLLYDKVGWEEAPSQFVIREVEINPPLDDGIFSSAEIDFGQVVRGEDELQGEVFGQLSGSVLTNLSSADLEALGIEHGDLLELRWTGGMLGVKYLENIQLSAAEIGPGEVYLCGYPASGFRRLMLMAFDVDVTEQMPVEKGTTLTVARSTTQADADSDEAPTGSGEEE
jgi:hypothetical protein